jgi:hypothetical protein
MSFSFQTIKLKNQTNDFHNELLWKKGMLVETCASNYMTMAGLANGFWILYRISPKAQMWINVIAIWFVGSNTRTQILHIY